MKKTVPALFTLLTSLALLALPFFSYADTAYPFATFIDANKMQWTFDDPGVAVDCASGGQDCYMILVANKYDGSFLASSTPQKVWTAGAGSFLPMVTNAINFKDGDTFSFIELYLCPALYINSWTDINGNCTREDFLLNDTSNIGTEIYKAGTIVAPTSDNENQIAQIVFMGLVLAAASGCCGFMLLKKFL